MLGFMACRVLLYRYVMLGYRACRVLLYRYVMLGYRACRVGPYCIDKVKKIGPSIVASS